MSLEEEVQQLRAEKAALRAENATLRAQVGTLTELEQRSQRRGRLGRAASTPSAAPRGQRRAGAGGECGPRADGAHGLPDASVCALPGLRLPAARVSEAQRRQVI